MGSAQDTMHQVRCDPQNFVSSIMDLVKSLCAASVKQVFQQEKLPQNLETEVMSSSLLPLLLQVIHEDSMTCSTEKKKKKSLSVFKYGRCTHSDNRGIHFITLQQGNL